MFDLIDEPWILATDPTGNVRPVGLRDVFSGETLLTGIRGDSPAQDYSIVRLLQSIFASAHKEDTHVGPGQIFDYPLWMSDQLRRIQRRGKDPATLAYLEKYRDRFDLFHSECPFMQVAGLRVASGEVKHITTIVPEAQDSYFSMRAGNARDSFSFAEAARWLVFIHAFDISGIKSGAVGDSRVKGGKGYPIGTGWSGMTGGTLVQGQSLLETLVLNTTPEALTNPQDKPVWERAPYGPDSRDTVGENPEPQGPIDLATWQSRRIRLQAEGDRVVGVVLGNGDKIPDAGANVMADTMTPYRFSTNKSKKGLDVYFPRPYDPERTMWRALDSLVVAETDGGFSAKEKAPKRPRNLDNLAYLSQRIDGVPEILNVDLVSVEYGPQASSVVSTYSAHMSMPVLLLLTEAEHLRTTVRSAAKSTMDAAIALGRFAGNLLVAAGGAYEFRTAPTDQVLGELEPRFNAWLRTLASLTPDDDGSTHFHNWQATARSTITNHALVMLRGAGPKALAGRIEHSSSEDKGGRVVSAATYYQMLQKNLDQLFPLTVKKEADK